MSGESPNVITPRQMAVAVISEKIADVRARIDAHRRYERADNLFNSQAIVFLEQVAFELQRAARHVELTDDADDEET
jgi:hypothetical protein